MRRNHLLPASYPRQGVITRSPMISVTTRSDDSPDSEGTSHLRRIAFDARNLPYQNGFGDSTNNNISLKKFNYLVKKQKKLAKKSKKESVEIARDASGEEWIQAEARYPSVVLPRNNSALTLADRLKIANYKSAQLKYEVVKKEMEENPELMKAHLQEITERDMPGYGYDKNDKKKNATEEGRIGRPGAYTCLVQKKLLEQRLDNDINEPEDFGSNLRNFSLFDKDLVNEMIEKSRRNVVLTEKLLYDVRYDNAWKQTYTKRFSKGKMKPTNRAGWVLPLQELCEKIGISSDFFTGNERVDLENARSFILYQRLTRNPEPSKWIQNDELNYRNRNLEEFFKKDWDGNGIIKRMNEFNRNVQNDLDRVRLQNRCTLFFFHFPQVKKFLRKSLLM